MIPLVCSRLKEEERKQRRNSGRKCFNRTHIVWLEGMLLTEIKTQQETSKSQEPQHLECPPTCPPHFRAEVTLRRCTSIYIAVCLYLPADCVTCMCVHVYACVCMCMHVCALYTIRPYTHMDAYNGSLHASNTMQENVH